MSLSASKKWLLVATAVHPVVVFVLLAIPLGHGQPLLFDGDWLICLAGFVLLSIALLVPFVAVTAVVAFFREKKLLRLLEGALLIALILGVANAELHSMWPLERRWYAAAGNRAKPLAAAIEAFQRDRGEPPPDLQALVPDFLPAVPGTGMRGFPRFRYLRRADGRTNPLGPVEAEWELYFPCGCFVGFDQFFYWPGGQYPQNARGGSIERIGDWAYVHE